MWGGNARTIYSARLQANLLLNLFSRKKETANRHHMNRATKNPVDSNSLVRGVCEAVRKRRIVMNISQEELSKRCGLHRTYISILEHGERNLSLKNLQRLAEALEVMPSQLIAEAESYSSGRTGLQVE